MARLRAAAREAFVDATYRRAARHRKKAWRTLFIAVTGSAGKTTTKDLVAAALGCRSYGSKSPSSHNAGRIVARTMLAVRPEHDFHVQELGASGPGTLDRAIALVRPKVAVITNVGSDHRKAFRTLEAAAAEKAKVVAAVPPSGLTVLNADDPLVMAMATRCRSRILTYGLGPGAALRAEEVTACWPDRLGFVVVHGEDRVPVQTRLCGEHWVHAVLAALATAVGLDVPLRAAVQAVAEVEPWAGRVSPVELGGVTFIRDDFKAPLWSVRPALRFLAEARAARKVAVIGTISDYGPRASAVYTAVAREALDAADEVVFVGPQAPRSAGARSHPRGGALHHFDSLREAADHLDRTLRPGDLVLLKGSHRADHLVRLVLSRRERIACWRRECGRMKPCDQCLLLRVPELSILRLPSRRAAQDGAGG
jgi:UDP-N-acetylmuramyl pentapeptide synthase